MRQRRTFQLPQITLSLKVFYHITVLTLGSMVIPTLWHALHDETVYPDPYKYDPTRWAPDGIAEQHPKSILLQFH
jgi:cytochrome P450